MSAGLRKAQNTLAVVAASVAIDCTGLAGAALQLTGTFSATAVFEGTIDGVTWVSWAMNAAATPGTLVTSATAAGLFQGSCLGFTQVRARCTVYASGAIVATLTAAEV